MLAGAILTDDEVVISNCPKIIDVDNMIEILKALGVDVIVEGNTVVINSKQINCSEIPFGLAKELRSSVFMLGALLGKTGKAKITYPGGCNIGLRPIDLHIKAMKELGVDVREEYGEIYLSDIGDDTFIWRLLTRAEFKEVANKQAGPYEREEQYCALCTIWPENYDFMSGLGKAGVPSILAEEILTKSGFKPNHVPIQL